ncbi:hypothetical protein DFJ73DRAFT_250757 [Zopfochytrium polystomum]|nr:hypothetical protein DFJ73DRAFT_250757 [Zopfochytrium polystomum]
MVISGLCALFIVEAMQCIPGNRFFQGTVEFATLINFYFGPVAHAAGQFCLFGALQSLAVSSIIQSSQTIDNLLIDLAGRTCGLAFSKSSFLTAMCVSEHGTQISPFGSTYMLVTAGYLVVLAFVVPLCIFPLTEYVSVQIGAFFVTLGIFCVWVINAFQSGLHASYVPTLGSGSGYAGLIGVVMLNYAYVQTIPSWVNVKKPEVNIQWSIWTSNLIGLTTYLAVGLIPALAYVIPDDSNLVAVISLLGTSNKIFGYLFSLLVLMTSIPVFLSISQLNITQNFKVNRYVSILLCFGLPWTVSIPFLTGGYLLLLNIWGSLIFVSTANFVVPLGIYLKAINFRKTYNRSRLLTPKQRQLLRVIHAYSGLNRPKLSNGTETDGRAIQLPAGDLPAGVASSKPPSLLAVPTVVVDTPSPSSNPPLRISSDSWLTSSGTTPTFANTASQPQTNTVDTALEDAVPARPSLVVSENATIPALLSVPIKGRQKPSSIDSEQPQGKSAFAKASTAFSTWVQSMAAPPSPESRPEQQPPQPTSPRAPQRSKSIVAWMSTGNSSQLPLRSKSVALHRRYGSSAQALAGADGLPGSSKGWGRSAFAAAKPISLFEIDPETEHYLFDDVPDPYEDKIAPSAEAIGRHRYHSSPGEYGVEEFELSDRFASDEDKAFSSEPSQLRETLRDFPSRLNGLFRKPTRGFSLPMVVVTESKESSREQAGVPSGPSNQPLAPKALFFPDKQVVVMEPEEDEEEAKTVAGPSHSNSDASASATSRSGEAGTSNFVQTHSSRGPRPPRPPVRRPRFTDSATDASSPAQPLRQSSMPRANMTRTTSILRSPNSRPPPAPLLLSVPTSDHSPEPVCASPVSSRGSSSPSDFDVPSLAQSARPRLGFSIDSSNSFFDSFGVVEKNPSPTQPSENDGFPSRSAPVVRFDANGAAHRSLELRSPSSLPQVTFPDAPLPSHPQTTTVELSASSSSLSPKIPPESQVDHRRTPPESSLLAVPQTFLLSTSATSSSTPPGLNRRNSIQSITAASLRSEMGATHFLTSADVAQRSHFGDNLIPASKAPSVGTGSSRASVASKGLAGTASLSSSVSRDQLEPPSLASQMQKPLRTYSGVTATSTATDTTDGRYFAGKPGAAAVQAIPRRPSSTNQYRRTRYPSTTRVPMRMASTMTGGTAGDAQSRVILDDGASVPVNQFYASVSKRSPPFRSLPKGFPVSPWTMAVVCLVITCASTLANLVYVLGNFGS